MKRLFLTHKITAACLGLCLATTAGWMIWHTTLRSDVLAAIPQTMGESPIDQTITKWMDKVKQASQGDQAWTQLGDALMQKARETTDTSYYGHAEAVFHKALSLEPQNVAAMIGLARVSHARSQFAHSIEWANKALAIDPKSQDAYGLLGDAALEMGQYDEAFKHYQTVLDIRPDLTAYRRAARLLSLTGDVRKANLMLQRAIATSPASAQQLAQARAELALTLWGNGAFLPAQQLLHKALEHAPHNSDVLAAMGRVKAARKDYEAAIDYYQQAIAITPQHDALVALGDLFHLTGQEQEAEQLYARVEALHQSNKANGVRDDIQMVRFYADHDRHIAEALQEAERIYQTRQNVFVADTLAWCYYKNGRYQEAHKAIKKALSQKTSDATTLFHAGLIYAKLSDRPAAQQYLYRALSLNPSFHPIYATVAADTLKQLGSKDYQKL